MPATKSYSPPSNIVYFGCRPWEPSRDATCTVNPVTGIATQARPTKLDNAKALGLIVVDGRLERARRAGRAARCRPAQRTCPVCKGRPPVNGYCEGCSRAHRGFKGPSLITAVKTAAQLDDAAKVRAEAEADRRRDAARSMSFAQRHHGNHGRRADQSTSPPTTTTSRS